VAKGLSAFGRMMTEGDLPDRGTTEMEPALEALVTVLVSRKRRNAIVTGLPGTGKTAVIRELARRIVARDERIPAMLHDYDIFELSPLFLRSGASVVGQYEERIKALIQVLTEHPKVILFVDEIHSLFESDMHGGGPFAGANEAFKGVLNRGDIICIGCTTTAEYRHYIQPNKALARRFKEIKLEPPSAETALRILQSRLAHVAEHYAGLRIPESILPRVVELAEEFLPAQYQPDKSIQLLDQACAWCMVKRRAAGEVDEEALVHALEHTLGRRVVRPEQLTKDQVLERLNRKIVGQDKVLEGVAQAFITGLSQWSRHEGPRGAFFFGGPTGVGKTEVALMLAEIYGGDRSALIRVDCNTLQGSGYDDGPIRNILLGVPPGYVGYVLGQGGLLSRIRDFPASIVLFDEFEKASPGVGNLLLAILDKGQAEDTDGNLLDFRHAFFVFTSNAGCSYGDSGFIGYQIPGLESDGVPKANKQAITEELIRRVGLGREFIGRLSHVFIFNGLDSQAIGKVLLDKLAELVELAKGRGYGLTWDDGLVEHLVRRWQPQFGVRFLTNMLHNRIVERLSVAEAQGKLKGVTTIRVTAGKLPEGAEAPELVGAASHEQEGDTLVIRVV